MSATVGLAARASATIARGRTALYHLLDRFTTADAAPITAPRTAEPGPGRWLITDSGNQLSVSSGALQLAGNGGAGAVCYYDHPTLGRISRVCGRALLWSWRYTGAGRNWHVGWKQSDCDSSHVASMELNASFSAIVAPAPGGSDAFVTGIFTQAADTTYQCAIVLRSNGAWFLAKGGSLTRWTLLYIHWQSSPSSNVNPALCQLNASAAATIDNLRVVDLGDDWTNDFGIANHYAATTADGATATMEADGWVEHTITAATDVTQELMVRRTDDNNCWIVRMNQGNSTVKLIQKEGGSETERSSAAQTWTNGTAYRVLVLCAGNTIKVYVAEEGMNSYTSASFNNTATGVKVSKAGARLACWPRTISIPPRF